MSTHVPGFQSFIRFIASFCIGQISHQQHKGLNSECMGDDNFEYYSSEKISLDLFDEALL